jgi:hypothetical protein
MTSGPGITYDTTMGAENDGKAEREQGKMASLPCCVGSRILQCSGLLHVICLLPSAQRVQWVRAFEYASSRPSLPILDTLQANECAHVLQYTDWFQQSRSRHTLSMYYQVKYPNSRCRTSSLPWSRTPMALSITTKPSFNSC